MQTNPNHVFGHGFEWDVYVCPICGLKHTSRTTIGQGFDNLKQIKVECENCNAKTIIRNKPPFRGYELSESEVVSIFDMAGIKILNKYKIKNRYWTEDEDYVDMFPWWLVKTEFGLIEIGWRKRVLSIDWSDTNIRKIVTSEDVTKEESYVHAWSVEKAVEYLKNLISG